MPSQTIVMHMPTPRANAPVSPSRKLPIDLKLGS